MNKPLNGAEIVLRAEVANSRRTAIAAASRCGNSSAIAATGCAGVGGMLKIAERRAILDAHEQGAMGSVSFIL